MEDKLTSEEEEEVIDLTKELIKRPSTVRDGPEIYEFAERYLKEHGLDVTNQTVDNPHIQYHSFNNIYVRVGNGKGPKMLLNGHLDTVDKKNGWYYPPYDAVEEGGKIFGLGACDMKGGCAAAILSLIALKKRKKNINGELFLSLVFGEEAPFSLGTDTLLREFSFKDYDLIIVAEPSPSLAIYDYCRVHKKIHKSSFPTVIIGAEGRAMFEIELFGKASHASHPSQGINALHDASRLINELARFDLYSHIKMGRGHYVVLNIEGGDQSFTVPGYCRIYVNRQLTLGEDYKSVLRELKGIIKALRIKSKVSIKKRYSPTPELEYKPYICEKGEYFKKFLDMMPPSDYGRRKGKKGKKCLFTTSSVGDNNLFGSRTDVPVIVFGPGGKNIHAPNEYVNRQDIIDTANYLLRYLMEVY